MKQQLDTPILLMVFNRPKLTQEIFNEIRKAKPKQLFISIDGSRNEEDKRKINEVLKIVRNVDWSCKFKILIRPKNLGMFDSVIKAYDWFFDNVEQGIILEDDCIPSQDFFWFCQEMLERYRYDKRIMHISGWSYTKDKTKESYYFSKYPQVGSWGMWKRSYKKLDLRMKYYPNLNLKGVFPYTLERLHVKKMLDNSYGKKISPDVKWLYSVIINNGLCVTPEDNLIEGRIPLS